MQQKKMLLGNCSCLELWGLGDVDAPGRDRQAALTRVHPGPCRRLALCACAGGLGSLELCKIESWPVQRSQTQVLAGPSRCCGSAKGAAWIVCHTGLPLWKYFSYFC